MGGRKNQKKKTRGVIETVDCEHCRGSGRVQRAATGITVGEALAGLLRLQADGGWLVAGGLEMEISIQGHETTIEGMQQVLIDDGQLVVLGHPAKDMTVGTWRMDGVERGPWQMWSLADVVQNRIDAYAAVRSKGASGLGQQAPPVL